MWQEYYRPQTLKEALEILGAQNSAARVIAGGTDLILDLKKGSKLANYLVDIRRIPGMNVIEERWDKLYVGAGVTHTQAATSQLIREKATALAEAAALVGSLQVRNVATVVGNIVNAQPAADTAVALVALGATAEIVSIDGSTKVIPVAELYAGPGRSKVDSTRSIVTGVYIPIRPGRRSAFQRIARRKALALPVLNAAVALVLAEGVIEEVSIAAGPIGPQPVRLREVEQVLQGQKVTPEVIDEAARVAAAVARPRDSVLRGSRAYRQGLLGVMVRRILAEATA